MSRIGVWSKCVLRLGVKQSFRQNSLRCLSSVSNRQQFQVHRKNRICHRILTLNYDYDKDGNYRLFSDKQYPEHQIINLPALSPTMEVGTISSWAKKEGDKLNEGDLLAEIETDKATVGLETQDEGYLAKILIPAGTRNVPIGKPVCVVVKDKESVAAFKNFKAEDVPGAPAPQPTVGAPPPPPRAGTPAPPEHMPSAPEKKGRLFVSPMAKRLAEQKKIRLELLGKGSGLLGSITSKDLDKTPMAPPSSTPRPEVSKQPMHGLMKVSEHKDIPLTNMREVIAKRLMLSKQTIPHYYLSKDLCIDELLAVRKELNTSLEKSGIKLTLTDFIIKATAIACKRIPEVNSSWMDSFIREYSTVDVSLAVSTDKGLITPIIFGAEKKGLITISKDIKVLATKAREGKLKPHEFQGGTISVSNLGMFGVTQFAAVINPPQGAIVAVGSLQERMVPNKKIKHGVMSSFMNVTLSCDHRVIDGAVGARWLQEFKSLIETPSQMLL